MKKLLCIAVWICFTNLGVSQAIFFPQADYADSASLARAMPILAKRVIAEYRNPDTSALYGTLYRAQIVAQEYTGAERTLAAYSDVIEPDSTFRRSIAFSYKVYCRVMALKEADRGRPFSDLYDEAFSELFRPLSEKEREDAGFFFTYDLTEFKKTLDELIASQRNAQSDSIALTPAVALCKNYCRWLVYATTGTLATELLTKFENETYISEDSVLVKTADGGTVSLTVVRKKDAVLPQAVALMYTIYPGFDHLMAREAAMRGYVGVVANTRGKRLSPDAVEPFEHDAKDAYSIIDWITKQPWCNGKVGMWGGSYLGFAQWSAAKHLHPSLLTIVPQVAVGIGIDYPMQNGIFCTYMLRWIHLVSDTKLTDWNNFQDTAKWNNVFAKWYRSGSSMRQLDTVEGRPNAIFQRWLDHPSYDRYWKDMTPQQDEFSRITIPVLTITGYWDDDQLGAMYYYKQHHQWNKNTNHYLLIGPYDHGGSQGFPSPKLSGYTIDSVANIPISDIVFQWFDHVMKDSAMPAILSDKVNFEVMGANQWRHVSSLEKMNNDTLSFSLSDSMSDGQYRLLPTTPGAAGFIESKVDFKDRTVIEPTGDAIDAFPALLDSVLHPGKKLVFMSDRLKEDMTISGSMKASIRAAINKKDMDVVVDLYAQMPDGHYLALNENVQRASYAKDRTTRRLLEPNTIEQIELTNTFMTSIRLTKGSRIVVMVGVNLNPQWQINYGTGKDVSEEDIRDANTPLDVKWYTSSTIKIPIWK